MKNKKSSNETDEIADILGGGSNDDESESQVSTQQESDVKGEGEGVTEQPAKVKLGEEELSTEELSRLVKKAREVESIEKDQNINIDQLYPDYTRKSQLLSDPVRLGQFIAEKYGAAKVPSPDDELRRKALDEARNVYGIVTKEDLDAFKQSFKEELETDSLVTDLKEIEAETGVPGRDVLDFMQINKVDDPYEAATKISEFRKMNGTQPSVKQKPTFTEKSSSSGTHVPPAKKLPSIDDTEGIRNTITDMMSSPGVEED